MVRVLSRSFLVATSRNGPCGTSTLFVCFCVWVCSSIPLRVCVCVYVCVYMCVCAYMGLMYCSPFSLQLLLLLLLCSILEYVTGDVIADVAYSEVFVYGLTFYSSAWSCFLALITLQSLVLPAHRHRTWRSPLGRWWVRWIR